MNIVTKHQLDDGIRVPGSSRVRVRVGDGAPLHWQLWRMPGGTGSGSARAENGGEEEHSQEDRLEYAQITPVDVQQSAFRRLLFYHHDDGCRPGREALISASGGSCADGGSAACDPHHWPSAQGSHSVTV